ncbi:MAG: hypothetical protein JWN14_154 [Chthonomonadales bacterium]|nr:hypothetical protein [Chthonomonadales bacterium]
MNKVCTLISGMLMLGAMLAQAHAQNWILAIQDPGGTPVNQVNGTMGTNALLYGSFLNFTGTLASDDGTGQPASATLLDFAGFGFVQNAGQTDLGSLFIPDSRMPGYPQVPGSADGDTPGDTPSLVLGTFDISSLTPGTYQEDFLAGAYPDDFNSSVPFGTLTGTLTLVVMPSAATPEPATWYILALASGTGLFSLRRRKRRMPMFPTTGGK